MRERVRKMESSRVVSTKPAASPEQAALGTPAVSQAARAAYAADMPVKAAPAPYRPPCAQFGGWYGGLNVGWGFYEHTHSDRGNLVQTIDDDLPTEVHSSKSGVTGGLQAGYNWQSNCTVFGWEADWNWADTKANSLHTDGDGGTEDALTVQSRLRWVGTFRGRAGVVVDNLLIYATGGLAFANFDRTVTVFEDAPASSAAFSSSNTRLGLVGGVGAEWMLANNWSIKGEVLYMRFEEDSHTFTGNAPFGVSGRPYRFDSEDSIWVARLGVNVKFGDYGWGKGPVAARY